MEQFMLFELPIFAPKSIRLNYDLLHTNPPLLLTTYFVFVTQESVEVE